jgi:hypothetical protein
VWQDYEHCCRLDRCASSCVTFELHTNAHVPLRRDNATTLHGACGVRGRAQDVVTREIVRSTHAPQGRRLGLKRLGGKVTLPTRHSRGKGSRGCSTWRSKGHRVFKENGCAEYSTEGSGSGGDGAPQACSLELQRLGALL